MDLLCKYKQVKKEKKDNLESTCDLYLYGNENRLTYVSEFEFDYLRYNKKRKINYRHQLDINLRTGDIITNYELLNDTIVDMTIYKTSKRKRKNKFKFVSYIIDSGFIKGEKREKYWGIKYDRAIDSIYNTILKRIQSKFKSEYLKDKKYDENCNLSTFFELLVDFHLDMKGIKSHDTIYFTILDEYPDVEWLKNNDYKFLPSVLESYGIKSKYLVGELNKPENFFVNIKTLNYICKLFGENYIDYLKKFNWVNFCGDSSPNKNIHTLKNEFEKRAMIKVLNKWEKNDFMSESFVSLINQMLSTRDFLETRGLLLIFKSYDEDSFNSTLELWEGMRQHFKKGFRLRYNILQSFVDFIEKEIIVNDKIFIPQILKSEDDYKIEGYIMKNCMGKQFIHGAIYLYLSLTHKKTRINLQYRKGKLSQSYGKANTPVDELFTSAIEILSNRIPRNSMEKRKI